MTKPYQLDLAIIDDGMVAEFKLTVWINDDLEIERAVYCSRGGEEKAVPKGALAWLGSLMGHDDA